MKGCNEILFVCNLCIDRQRIKNPGAPLSLGPSLFFFPSSSDRSLLTFIPVSALYFMKLLLPVILALIVVASSAHKFTARKVIRQELHNRASSVSSFSNRQTTTNITNHGVNIRCVVSALLSSCAKQDSSSIYDLIYLANVSSAYLLSYNHMPMVL